jgi:uncharacterized membrane protein YgdD (TMEM256/DUF423 family)
VIPAIGLGAFGAYAFRASLSARMFEIYLTAVLYYRQGAPIFIKSLQNFRKS